MPRAVSISIVNNNGNEKLFTHPKAHLMNIFILTKHF